MSKVNRTLLLEGRVYVVEFAVAADGSEPGREFLEALAQGEWDLDPDSESIPDDEQVTDHKRLLANIRYFAENGEPRRRGDINSLRHGLWEFKVARKRLTFYDVGEDGKCEPKNRIRDRREADNKHSQFWWIPDFDDVIRLGWPFPKLGQKTDELDLARAGQLRKEDLSHDIED